MFFLFLTPEEELLMWFGGFLVGVYSFELLCVVAFLNDFIGLKMQHLIIVGTIGLCISIIDIKINKIPIKDDMANFLLLLTSIIIFIYGIIWYLLT